MKNSSDPYFRPSACPIEAEPMGRVLQSAKTSSRPQGARLKKGSAAEFWQLGVLRKRERQGCVRVCVLCVCVCVSVCVCVAQTHRHTQTRTRTQTRIKDACLRVTVRLDFFERLFVGGCQRFRVGEKLGRPVK